MIVDEYAKPSRVDRMQRLECGPDGVDAAIRGHGDDALMRRPDAKSWAPKEVVCHMRDIEELLMTRLSLIVATNEPAFYVRVYAHRRDDQLALSLGQRPRTGDRRSVRLEHGHTDAGAP